MLLDEVQRVCFVDGKLVARRLQTSFLEEHHLLQKLTSLEESLHTNKAGVVRWLEVGSPPQPQCPVCKVGVCNWGPRTNPDGWSLCCSNACTQRHPKMKASIKPKFGLIDIKQRETRRRATTLEKYGVDHIMKIKSIAKAAGLQAEATRIERYGAHWAKDQYDAVKLNSGGVYPWDLSNPKHSKIELTVIDDLLRQFPGLLIENGNRKVLDGKEIDIWIPEKRLGIEVNGWWWHREHGPSRKSIDRRHIFEKNQLCAARGIQLLNFWDFDLSTRYEQCMNLIYSKINSTRKIGARMVDVKEINKVTAVDFINQNHIQQTQLNRIQHAFGLFLGDELLSVMSFGKHPRRGSVKTTVLNRFCSQNQLCVIGGASKLLKFAQETMQFRKVLSWSDKRFSNGNVYDKLGFVIEGTNPPDYQYIELKTGTIRVKSTFMKSKIQAAPGQTEYNRALELGWDRIWDCGKVRWVKTWD